VDRDATLQQISLALDDVAQLGETTDLLEQILNDAVLGVYLHGSAVLGGLRPASDLDVLAVSGRRLSHRDRQHLARDLLRISGGYPLTSRRALDVQVVSATDLRPWRYPPRVEFHFGEWRRESFERMDPMTLAPRNDPDLTVAIALTRSAGVVLVGPPPRALLDPVPRGDLERAMLDGIDPLVGDLGWDTWNVLLTLARVWRTLASGAIVSKAVAADWAIERLPADEAATLRRGRDWYIGSGADASPQLARPAQSTADAMLAKIRTASAHGGAPGAGSQLPG
jgi:streptomycin 3"-adenylyltransferase